MHINIIALIPSDGAPEGFGRMGDGLAAAINSQADLSIGLIMRRQRTVPKALRIIPSYGHSATSLLLP